jgi:catechol 2,3-dioxygenase-like lactoylglutathione lyase family enzyme
VVLLNGFNHVAVLTNDTDRLHAFYRDVFDAETAEMPDMPPGMRLTFIYLGPTAELNVFEIDGNAEAQRQEPDFERGRLDHFGLQAASREAFDEVRRRLMDKGASDGFVTDFGPAYSVFFRDPDGLAGEVLWSLPDADPTVLHPPGTPAPGYDQPSVS